MPHPRTWHPRPEVPAPPVAGALRPVRRVGLLSVHTSPLAQPGSGDSGGMNVYVLALARRLGALGVAVELFTRATSARARTVAVADNVRVHHLVAGPPDAAKGDLASHLCAFYLALARHPALKRTELLHGHYWMSGWVGRQARRRLGIPLVQSFHTLGRVKNAALPPGDTPEPMLRLTAEVRIVADADAIVAATPTEAVALREWYAARPGHVHVVEPGVDLDVFTPDGPLPQRPAPQADRPLLMFAGRLQPLKAPDVAIRTLAALDRTPARDLRPRLVIAGGSSGGGAGEGIVAALRRLAVELGVAERVTFVAPLPQHDLAALYRAADVVLVPSHSESFGLVALEAQACGTAVVAADVGGLRHAVGNDGGGALVASREPEAFAAAVAPFLLDPRRRAQAREAGRRKALAHGWERTAERTLQLYAQVLAHRGRAADAQGA